MKFRHHRNLLGSALLLLALLGVLLAPIAAICHTGLTATPAATAANADQHHEGCPDHQSQPSDDDCCTSSACSCACHAPLPMALHFRPLTEVRHRHALEPRQVLPSVYLAIFVPPQNRP
jgi:hypothetical protein